MSIASHYNWFLACAVAATSKSTTWVFDCNIVGLDDVKSLLEIHAGAKCFLAGSSEDGASQATLTIVPLPEHTELDCGFHRQAIHVFGSVYCDKHDVFAWKLDNDMLDMRIWFVNPVWHRVLGSW
jgi:hypothetical protein